MMGVGVGRIGRIGAMMGAAPPQSAQWVLAVGATRALLDLDFNNNRAYVAGVVTTPAAILSVARTKTVFYPNAAGLYTAAASGVPRISDLGLFVEDGNINNYLLYNRDLTNAAWTKSNMTVAKDQTGVDGVANSACSITATAANATVLQTTSHGSTTVIASAFVKRLTGSGTVSMTMNNGSTWTDVTVTGALTRVNVPSATLTNGTVGFRLATSGDAIAVDLVQHESGAFVTSPFQTTIAGTLTRDQEGVSLNTSASWLNVSAATLYVEASPATGWSSGFGVVTSLSDDTSSNRVSIARGNIGTNHYFEGIVGGATQWQQDMTASSWSTKRKTAVAWAANNAQWAYAGTLGAGDASVTVPTIAQLTKLRIGDESAFASRGWYGTINRVALFGARLSNSDLQTLTT